MEGRASEGIAHLEEALRLAPNYAEAHGKLALALAGQGRLAEALRHYHEALRRAPDSVEVLNNFAWLLATCAEEKFRDGAAAVQHAERACELTRFRRPIMMGTLAAAYAEAGRLQDAVAMGEKALALAGRLGQRELARKNEKLLKLYRAGQPYREGGNEGQGTRGRGQARDE
jgi:Tfp pilus assembly protein PilF